MSCQKPDKLYFHGKVFFNPGFFQKVLSVLPKKRFPFISAADQSLFSVVLVTVLCKTTVLADSARGSALTAASVFFPLHKTC